MSDAATVVLAGLVWLGARLAVPLPLALGVGVALLALALRRPGLVLVAGLLLGSTYGARAVDGLVPVAPRAFAGTVTLLSDPADGLGSTVADVRVGRRRVELRAVGGARGGLSTRLAGERVAVAGRLRAPPPDAPWLVPRHVVGILEVTTVEPADAGSPPWRAANVVRRTLVRGAASMDPARRSLFLGFVLGDDRDQPVTVEDDFRGSGLTHLLAVSGENVAFVLALVGPLVRRLGLGWRWAATVAIIGFFCLVTRFEPSVVRAGAMAALAATAFALGRPASGVRLLALAVAALVLIDPLLTRSVGFELSVAASAGILVLAPRVRTVLPGPAWLADPLAVTAGAQVAVAPLLITTFGGVPVASLPANLLAGPAAGLVMMWGLGAGIPAGLVGGRAAVALHGPTAVGIGWIAGVARVGASVPLGEIQLGHLAALAAGLGVAVLAGRRARPTLRRVGIAVAVVALLVPAVALRSAPAGPSPVSGGQLWRAGGATVLVVGAVPRLDGLLEGLRRLGIRRIDLLVATGSAKGAGATVAAVAHRWPPAEVWTTDPAGLARARAPASGTTVQLGALRVSVDRTGPPLVVAVAIVPVGMSP